MADDMVITEVSGSGVPIRGDDVDTDQILPARFMKVVTFEDMDEYLFYDARRDENGELNDHPLNRFTGANVAVVNKNFGSGSSREHAPQALMRWGIDAIVGESFAEIFQDNCKSLGIPTVTASEAAVTGLQDWIEANPEGDIEVDVETETVTYDDEQIDGEIDTAMQEALLEGIWDTTTLMYSNLSKVEQTASELPYVEGDD
jgi:3-isopropylmalate/(R)-2-methylmalate dehydratase small subunit